MAREIALIFMLCIAMSKKACYNKSIERAVEIMTYVGYLTVKFSDGGETTYYIDKDQYSVAHRISDKIITLDSFEGKYTFDESKEVIGQQGWRSSKSVTLAVREGVTKEAISVSKWRASLGCWM